jgi:hypothetical protein
MHAGYIADDEDGANCLDFEGGAGDRKLRTLTFLRKGAG